MPKKNLIQVFEYQKLRFTDENDFKENHFKALVKFNEENDNKYFKPIYNGIQFGNYVGVIQIGGLTIEILPKADKNNNDSPEEKETWQGVLLHMLKVCKKIQVKSVSETQLKKRYHSILEAYFAMYLEEIEHLIKRGLIKKYRRIKSNQLALKGRLVFAQNIQKNIVHKERFYCEHQVYDKDHLIHQILLKGLQVLESLSNSHLKDKINRLLFQLDDVEQINISANHFKNLRLNRKSQPYSRALSIAKMLILNYSPNISFGQDNMLTLLFDMNKLWEEYIFRVLNKHKPFGYKISFQNSDTFWENKTIRPDIVITNIEGENFIIDTKWKIVESDNPSDSDLKQMFTYNLHWESTKSMLLYPKNYQKDSAFGNYKYEHLEENANQCKLGFVSVLENGKIKDSEKLSEEILKKMNIKHEE
jgi:5-methylcytosine-specific restriction enzyme subunit McrC